ncbi:MAG: NUDIX domain-containing protein [Chloroflexota bacterium]
MLLNTICLLVKGDPISEVLLADKKIGFGAGKVVGVGGTVEPGETLWQTAVRELEEEIGVQIEEKDLQRAAKITFRFPGKPEWDRLVYVYFTRKWQGEIVESNEVKPKWYPVEKIPYDEMWADGAEWLPSVLAGRKIVARFTFAEDNETLSDVEVKDDQDYLWPHLKGLPYFRSLLRSVEASYYQDLDLPEPVLDVGSGDGHFASLVFDRKLDVGLDPWWEPLRESKQYDIYHALVQADAAHSPFPSGHFASALSNSVLEHIEHIDEVLAGTSRVLQPGAPFLFCVPNQGYVSELSIPKVLRKIGMSRLANKYVNWFMRISRTAHADSPEVWERRLKQAGFELERYWHYFSPASLAVLEWGHYFGAPSWVAKLFFGRWIIAPFRWNLALIERMLRRFDATEPLPSGTYSFFIARKQ